MTKNPRRMDTPWVHYMEPFKIKGNLYFVGCWAASSHLLDTKDGLVLIDTGYPQNLYLLLYSVHKLGFDIRNVRHIVHSHGHYDHLGATKALVELIGAKTYIGRGDEHYADGSLDLTWAKELGYRDYYEEFIPDVIMEDGDVLDFGDTKIEIVSTPGHTPGTVSMFFDVTEDGKTYKVGTHGGVGVNSMATDFLNQYGLSFDCRDKFLDGIERLKKRQVDIFIGNHVWNNDTQGRYARMMAGDADAFVDPKAWYTFLEECAEKVRELK